MYMQNIHFDNIIKHSVNNHSLEGLKDQAFRVKWKKWIYDYRSHNFNSQIPYMLYHNNNSKMDGLHVHGLSLSDDDNN
jgi:hypothetical protein